MIRTVFKTECNKLTVEYVKIPLGKNNAVHTGVTVIVSPLKYTPETEIKKQQYGEYFHISIALEFLNKIATECGQTNYPSITYTRQLTDPAILHFTNLLKIELKKGKLSGKQYVESLANVLVIHVVRCCS